jgi:hypothetical protein
MPGSVTPSVRRNIKAASVRLLTSAALVLANAARADEGAPPLPDRHTLLLEPAIGMGTPVGWAGVEVIVAPARALELHGGVGIGSQSPQLAAGVRARIAQVSQDSLAIGAGWSTGQAAVDPWSPLPFVALFDTARSSPPIWFWRQAHLINLDLSYERGLHLGVLRPFAGVGFIVNDAAQTNRLPDGRPRSDAPPLFARFVPYFGLAFALGLL